MANKALRDDEKKTARAVLIRTYATEEQLTQVMREHDRMINVCAYITHDRDKNEDGSTKVKHIHANVLLDRSRELSGTESWFKGLVDEKGKPIQTVVMTCKDTKGADDYLTHDTPEAKADGKFQYVDEDIKVLKGSRDDWREFKTDWMRKHDARIKKEADADEVEQLLQDIIDGVSAREMARRYGRDYVKNVKSYRHYASEIVFEEEGDLTKAGSIANGGAFESLLEREMNNATREGMTTALKVLANHFESRVNAGDSYLKTVVEDIRIMCKSFI